MTPDHLLLVAALAALQPPRPEGAPPRNERDPDEARD